MRVLTNNSVLANSDGVTKRHAVFASLNIQDGGQHATCDQNISKKLNKRWGKYHDILHIISPERSFQ